MKKCVSVEAKLVLVVYIVSVWFGCFECPAQSIPGAFVLDYSNGEAPWDAHIDTEINAVYDEVVPSDPNLRENICDEPWSQKKEITHWTCFDCAGAKMVVPRSRLRRWVVFDTPEHAAFFQQTHMVENCVPHHYYSKEPYQSFFFLIPFNGQEIPTYYPEQSTELLPRWKEAWIKSNHTTDDYFAQHVRIHSVAVHYCEELGSTVHSLEIRYWFTVDWARVFLREVFWDSLIVRDDSLSTCRWSKELSGVRKIEPVEAIIPKGEVVELAKKKSPLLGFDVNHSIEISRDGRLRVNLFGVVDDSTSRGMRSYVYLDNGGTTRKEEIIFRIN